MYENGVVGVVLFVKTAILFLYADWKPVTDGILYIYI